MNDMGNKSLVKDAKQYRAELLAKYGDSAAQEFDRLLSEGKKIQAMRWLKKYGERPND